MIDLSPIKGKVIPLGVQGENKARRVIFDTRSYIRTYGEGTAVVVFKPKGVEAYPVILEHDDGFVCWTVTDTDTMNAGYGQVEFQWHNADGEMLGKPARYETCVIKSITHGSDMPPKGFETWMDAMLQVGANVDDKITKSIDAFNKYLEELKETFKGDPGPKGDSAYDVAVKAGYTGTKEEWLESLKGKAPVKGVDYWTDEDKEEIKSDLTEDIDVAKEEIEKKGEEVIASIPEDYTQLSEDITELSENLRQLADGDEGTITGRLSESIAEISNKVDGIAIVSSGEYVPFDYSDKIQSNEGFVNSVNGTLRNGVANFFYTSPIPVTKGQQIKLNGYGSGANACWLSFWDSETATVGTTIKASVNKVETEFEWTVERDGFVRFSNNVSTSGYHLDVMIKSEGGIKLSDGIKSAVNEEIDKAVVKIATVSDNSESVIDILSIKNERSAFVMASYKDIRDATGYWFTNLFELKKGETINVKAYGSGTSVAWASRWTDENTCAEIIKASEKAEVEFSYTASHDIEYIRFSNNNESSVYHFDVTKRGVETFDFSEKAKKQIKEIADTDSTTVIEVGEGKDFTSLVEAVNSIIDSSEKKKYIINIYEGRYETIEESRIDANYRGLIIPNYVSICGIGNRDNIIISGYLQNESFSAYANNISTINLTMNGNVENVTIVSKNIRYCNHDDGTDTTVKSSMIRVSHVFKNVKFIVEEFDSGFSSAGFCVGIGGQADKEVIFESCEFITLATGTRIGVLAHDNASTVQKNGCRIRVENCIFNILSGYDVRVQNSGGDKECNLYLIGNKLSKSVRYTNVNTGITKNVWKTFARNNYGFALNNGTEFDLSGDVVEFGNVS